MPSELSCCSKPAQILRTVNLYDTSDRINQVLRVGRCKNSDCGCIVAELVWWDVKKNKAESYKPKKKNVAGFVRDCETNRYIDNIVEAKFGTHSNMNWVHGITTKKGVYAVDFNGTKTLIKEFKTA